MKLRVKLMEIYEKFKIRAMGEAAVLIEVADKISRKANGYVLALMHEFEKKNINGIIEMVPAYTTLLIYYNPELIDFKSIKDEIEKTEIEVRKKGVEEIIGERRVIEIPVAYGGEFGPDLEYVAKYANLTVNEVIKIHSNQTYLVYMIGFTPGFTYMGEVPEIIAAPRLKKPRLRVPAGSVGIAGRQTGIYPIESPGGWRIIGRTPIKLFDWNKDPPTKLKAGDYVKFKPISTDEFWKIHEVQKEKAEGKVEVKGIPAFEVIFAGPGVTIQDMGRIGYRKYGVPFSGALDVKSYMLANIIVGNKINSACIEVFQSTLTLKALNDVIVAFTGAKAEIKIDGEKAPLWQAIPIRKNSTISIEKFIHGQVVYIAVSSGISEIEIMGSKSYYLRGGVGRRFSKGSIIYIEDDLFNELIETCPARILPEEFRVKVSDETILRTIIGPHEDWFTNETINEFLSNPFKVTPHIDRMGFRLEGPVLKHAKGGGRLISCGTLPGAVQVPPDGNPIVLMAEAQTTGGYPIIGTVIQADLYKLAQSPPGSKVGFKAISIDEARKILINERNEIKRVMKMFEDNVSKFGSKYIHLTVKFNEKIIDAWIKEISSK